MTSETVSNVDAPSIEAPAHPSNAARNSLVINVLLVSTFVVMLNETAMSVAIPKLMSALSVDASSAQWLTTAFLLTMAVVIPVTGFLMQRLNSRPIFILAMSLFSAGTLLAALSLWPASTPEVVDEESAGPTLEMVAAPPMSGTPG